MRFESRSIAQRMGRAGRFAVEWLAFALIYALFAGKLSGAECAAAIAGGFFAAASRILVTRSGRSFAGGFVPAAKLMPRVIASLLGDSARVGHAFTRLLFTGRRPDARFVEVPFHPGGDDPRSRTRRGLVVAGISLAPNRYVADMRPGTGRLLVHQLVGAPAPKDERWPV